MRWDGMLYFNDLSVSSFFKKPDRPDENACASNFFKESDELFKGARVTNANDILYRIKFNK